MYDIIIVGSGPAGASAAYKLAKYGYSVLLLDKYKLPRYKPCGGAIPEELISNLKLPDRIIERYFESLNLYFKNEIIIRKGKGGIVSREKFDYYLTELAIENGAELKDLTYCFNVKMTPNSVKIYTTKDIFESRFLIAADGVNSSIALKSGIKKFGSKNIALTIQYELKIHPANLEKILGENILHLFFGKNISRQGYGWIFPKYDTVAVGWGCLLDLIENSSNEFNHFINFLKNMKNFKNLFKKSKIIKKVAHLVPFSIREELFKNNIFLIGDAAGFVDPISGKGIPYSILSGEIVAFTIEKYFDENNQHLISTAYIKNLKKKFLNILMKKKEIQPLIYNTDGSIYKFLKLWREHRSSEIALGLWNKYHQ